MAAVQVSDVIVPEVFTPYLQQRTTEKTNIIDSGVLVLSPVISGLLAGGGQTFQVPSFQDLDASDATGGENVASDTLADIQTASFETGTPTDANRGDSTPAKIGSSREVAARLVRNKSWSAMNLTAELAGADPMAAIGGRVANYWRRRYQSLFVSTFKGVLADNAAAPGGSDTHTQNDLTNDISGGGFTDGVTNFGADAVEDTLLTMGDSMNDLGAMLVHSVVYTRMKKLNLIDFIPDARGETNIEVYRGMRVIVDDAMPRTGSVYDTWFFGQGAAQFGEATHDRPVAVHTEELAGNGDGQEVLTTRKVIGIHPTGHAFIQGSIPDGGPANSDIETAANWSRRLPERKMIKFARLVTREA